MKPGNYSPLLIHPKNIRANIAQLHRTLQSIPALAINTCLAGLLLFPIAARAQATNTLAGFGTPTVDGRLSPGEWQNAARLDFEVSLPEGGTTPGTIFIMNDATNLYFAVRFARAVVDPGNTAEIDLDKDGSGSISAGDDTLLINPDIGFFDEVWTTNAPCPVGLLCGLFDTTVGGANNGTGGFSNNGIFSVYEFCHPFNSPDHAHDVVLAPGQGVRFAASIRIIGSNGQIADTSLQQLVPLLITSAPPVATNRPPDVVCYGETTLECGLPFPNELMVRVDDPDAGDPLTLVWNLNGTDVQTNTLPGHGPAPYAPYPLVPFTGQLQFGTNVLIIRVTDGSSNTVSCSTVVSVIDTTPPALTAISARPEVLWPPNQEMVEINLSAQVVDTCTPSTWAIVGVSSNESNDGTDWRITGEHTVKLRAARLGTGNGRVYTVALRATDTFGNLSEMRTVLVRVPHDKAIR